MSGRGGLFRFLFSNLIIPGWRESDTLSKHSEAIQLINYFAKADFEEFVYQMVESKFQGDYSLEALA